MKEQQRKASVIDTWADRYNMDLDEEAEGRVPATKGPDPQPVESPEDELLPIIPPAMEWSFEIVAG